MVKVIGFSFVDSTIKTITTTYHILDDQGNILKANLRRSFTLQASAELLEELQTMNVIDALAAIEKFIENYIEELL